MFTALFLATTIFQALPTDRILPKSGDMRGLRPADEICLSLAGGETESVQVIVAPTNDLTGVRVAVSDLQSGKERFPATDIDCDVVGYVQTTNAIAYTAGLAGAGWYPDAILPMPEAGISILKGDRNAFWIRTRCPEKRSAGTYRGTLKITAGKTSLAEIPFSVRVRNFTLSRKNPLGLAITFSPTTALHYGTPERERLEKDPLAPIHTWKKYKTEWYDFLAKYRLTVDCLYWMQTPRWEYLQQLKKEGRLGQFNLGYFDYIRGGKDAEQKWRRDWLAQIQKSYRIAKEKGLLESAYIYGCDEVNTNFIHGIQQALTILKRECPGVPIMTTAKDYRPDGKRAYGVGTILAPMNIFVPLTDKFDPEQAAKARGEGREVWWYVCCWPHGKWANLFVESFPIEARLLMGAMSAKMRPDGFLFYQISIWNSPRGISRLPYTDWVAQSYEAYHGDGSWTRVDAKGRPVPTIRLENFRDGLEDLLYVRMVEEKLGKRIEIPPAVMKTMDDYALSGDALMDWREKMANILEKGK